MRILIVEDEVEMQHLLQRFFSQSGYAVDTASDGEQGQYLGNEYPYDLAIIDVGLPHMNGIDLTKQLREKGNLYPVLILTARGRWQDKVEGLEAGADDYLTKPFHFEELEARVNALIRRSKGNTSSSVCFGPITLDMATKTVAVNHSPLELTSYEYRTLEYLMLNKERVISKSELTDHLYAQDFDRDSNVIEVFIGRLRKKLDPSGLLKPIATIRGQGYKFNLHD